MIEKNGKRLEGGGLDNSQLQNELKALQSELLSFSQGPDQEITREINALSDEITSLLDQNESIDGVEVKKIAESIERLKEGSQEELSKLQSQIKSNKNISDISKLSDSEITQIADAGRSESVKGVTDKFDGAKNFFKNIPGIGSLFDKAA